MLCFIRFELASTGITLVILIAELKGFKAGKAFRTLCTTTQPRALTHLRPLRFLYNPQKNKNIAKALSLAEMFFCGKRVL